MSGERRQSGRSPWWREAATLLGVVGLFVTFVFNTLAVRQSAEQDTEARETAQIELLTQLNTNASDSERAINETPAPDRRCDDRPAPLTLPDEAALRAALDYYQYLAWLFNHGRLTVTDSRDFFGERMIDGWRLGRLFFGDEMAIRYGELDRFVRATPPGDRDDGCA